MNVWKVVTGLTVLGILCIAPGCGGGFPVPELPTKVIGHCLYTNPFSRAQECKEYVGEWKVQDATNDCKSQDSAIVLNKKCGYTDDKRFGECIFIVDKAKDIFARVELPGTDKSMCESMKRGCEFFGGGSFVPSPLCGNIKATDPNKPQQALPVFQQPELICKTPRKGEPAGKGPDGKVCTWGAIAGATEPGRSFEYYGNCNMVRSQRPYYGTPPEPGADKADPRMKDPAYVKELTWVANQIKATSCVCCHSTKAPDGAANWYLESGPNWINSMSSRGLALGAGWINTVGFGAYAPNKNNGFTRPTPDNPTHGAFTTTDDTRMRKFFENELKFRGKTREDFKDMKYGAGPLDSQRFYKPKDCTSAQRIDKDGTIHWIGGDARYVQVMKADSPSPGPPPNLDIPKGTLWRIDVDWRKGTPIKSGSIKYGVTPKGLTQRTPVDGKAPALVSGRKYYLYVQKDVANPITRCLFTAP